MRIKFVLSVMLTALLWTDPVAAQQIKSPTELMPAKTLVYVEIRQAGELFKEIGALLKGSVLSDVPDSLLKVRAKYKIESGSRPPEGPGAVGLFFAPEIIAELGRLEGAAVAFTGIDANSEPEFVAVVLPGQCNAPALMMRALLTMGPVRPTETVDGVTLYRQYVSSLKISQEYLDSNNIKKFGRTWQVNVQSDNKPGVPLPPPKKGKEFGPVFAMSSGTLLVGSPGEVKQVIQRLKGKNLGSSLAKDATFQEARKQVQDEPGLFAYVNPAELLPILQKAKMKPNDKHAFETLLQVVNPKAVRAVALGLSLHQGNLTCRKLALLDPKQKSQVLDVLPSAALDPALLRFAPKDAVLVAAIGNAHGELRWQKVLAIADQFPPPGASGPKPSEMVKEFETKLGANLGKDAFGQIQSAAFVLGNQLKAPLRRTDVKGPKLSATATEPDFLFIVQAVDAKAAQNLEALWLVKLAADKNPQPEKKVETIEGRQIYSLKTGQDYRYYGREGATLVLGPYPAAVAQALNNGAKGNGLLANPQVAARLKKMGDCQALLLAKPAQLLAGLARSGNARNMSIGRSAEEEKVMKTLSKLLESEDILAVGLQRTNERIELDGQVGGLRRLIPELVDFAVETYYSSYVGVEERFAPKEKSPTPK